MNTPEKPSLECFSSIRSSSNINISDIPFFHDSPSSQKSREEGFSSSILLNLADLPSKPASRLINITQTRPGQIPKKLLLPLFYQEPSENSSHQIRIRRSVSLDSKKSSITTDPIFEQKKIVTTTTVNTQSNTDFAEFHPEFLKAKTNFNFEQNLKDREQILFEFGPDPGPINCQFCGFQGTSVVERKREKAVWLMKNIKKTFCCCFGIGLEERIDHSCPMCKGLVFSLNG